jgi:DNA-binding NarL/FixJ family response regulator
MEGPRSVTTPIRVLIAEDHRLFAEALEAVTLAAELQPDVVLMDVRLPVLDGIEATRAIRAERPDACILMLTASSSRADVDRARRAGAAGYVTKHRSAAELVEAILEIAT